VNFNKDTKYFHILASQLGFRTPRRGRCLAAKVLAAVLGAYLIAPQARAETPQLVYAADFSKTKKLDEFWQIETGFFRNKEAQYYQPANVRVAHGALSLTARRQTVANAAFDAKGADWLTTTAEARYTSGSIVSRDAFTFGVFEIVARLPQSLGTWPAIWLVYEQGLPYREIDLVEAVGHIPDLLTSTITAGPDLGHTANWKSETPTPRLAEAFHTYRLEWRKDAIVISIDGRERVRMNPEEAHKNGVDPLREKMRMRINLALGGSWGGAIDDAKLPARLEIRSIKIWRIDP